MSSMSAHADEGELLHFLSNQSTEKLQQILLVHGEPKRQAALQKALLAQSYKSVAIPTLGQVFEL
jgi:metallo-beta-lactamase family protein